MADQLRRIIHPRSKTPVPPTGSDETGDASSSVTPLTHRKPRPRLSSRISSMLGGKTDVDDFEQFTENGNWSFAPPTDEFARTDPIELVEKLMLILLSNALHRLDASHHNALFKIFEAFRNLTAENQELKALLEELRDELKNSARLKQVAENQFAVEEDGFRQEIKRLELMICNGAQGVSGVAHARQNSIIDRRRKHTFSNVEDEASASNDEQGPKGQSLGRHATIRAAQASILDKEVELSRRLSTMKDSSDFVVGTPPKSTAAHSLSSMHHSLSPGVDGLESLRGETSDDGFSSAGDLLPDEIAERRAAILSKQDDADEQAIVNHLASLIAVRKGLSLDHTITTLIELIDKVDLGEHEMSTVNAVNALQMPSNGYGNQSTSNVQTHNSRPFSFVTGDDDGGLSNTGQRRVSGPGLSGPFEHRAPVISERPGSLEENVPRSPVSSPGGSVVKRRASKIPSPAGAGHTSPRRASPRSSSVHNPGTIDSFARQASYQSSIESSATVVRHESTNESRSSSNSGHGDTSKYRSSQQRSNTSSNVAALAAARAIGRGSSASAMSKHKEKRVENQQPSSTDGREHKRRSKHRSSVSRVIEKPKDTIKRLSISDSSELTKAATSTTENTLRFQSKQSK